MKKWRKILILSLVLAVFGVGSVFAASVDLSMTESRVFDMADLFSTSEEEALSAGIMELQGKMDMGVAIVTCEENRGSARDFADDFYEEYEIGFGDDHDGALFLIDMENGELWISTEGKMLRYLTDGRIEAILDDVIDYAYNGEFYETAEAFLEDLEICYDNGIASDQYNYDTETGRVSRYHSIQWYEFLIAFAVAAAVAGGTVMAVVREYNMKDNTSRIAANFNLSYRKDSGFTLHNILTDMLIGSYVTRTVIRRQNPRPGGGGGGRSSGGRSFSSGGRTSTHRSSSGRSHGGGGRKFR